MLRRCVDVFAHIVVGGDGGGGVSRNRASCVSKVDHNVTPAVRCVDVHSKFFRRSEMSCLGPRNAPVSSSLRQSRDQLVDDERRRRRRITKVCRPECRISLMGRTSHALHTRRLECWPNVWCLSVGWAMSNTQRRSDKIKPNSCIYQLCNLSMTKQNS